METPDATPAPCPRMSSPRSLIQYQRSYGFVGTCELSRLRTSSQRVNTRRLVVNRNAQKRRLLFTRDHRQTTGLPWKIGIIALAYGVTTVRLFLVWGDAQDRHPSNGASSKVTIHLEFSPSFASLTDSNGMPDAIVEMDGTWGQ